MGVKKFFAFLQIFFNIFAKQGARGGERLLQVDDFHIAPVSLQIFGNQAAMAVMRFMLAAQQAGIGDVLFCRVRLDLARLHESEKRPFITRPVAALFLVGVQYLLTRRQLRERCRLPGVWLCYNTRCRAKDVNGGAGRKR